MNRPITPSVLGVPLAADAGESGLITGPERAAPTLKLVPPRARIRADTAPLPAPGATFETRRLVAVGNERLELVPTWQERVFLGVFIGFAAALAAIGASRLGTDPMSDVLVAASAPTAVPMAWPPIVAAAALTLVAVMMARAGGRVVLDGRTRQLSRAGGVRYRRDERHAGSRRPRERAAGARRRLGRVGFDELVGVQRLACRIADEEVSWTIHQVNLVMRDGSRVHICSHVEEALARRTAETVARFVGVDVLASNAKGDGDENGDVNAAR